MDIKRLGVNKRWSNIVIHNGVAYFADRLQKNWYPMLLSKPKAL